MTRRQAVMVLGLVAGGATLYQAFARTVEAGTAEVGTIGAPGSPVDLYGEDIYDTNDNQAIELPGDGSVQIEKTTINSSLNYPREILRYTSPLGVRNKGGGGSWFLATPVFSNGLVLHQQNATGSTIQVYSRVRDLSPGTASSPAVYEWDARLLNQEQYVDQYIGLGERFVRTPPSSIFLRSTGNGSFTNAGELQFQTGDGSGNYEMTAIAPSTVDMTNIHTYKVEWTDEPRATLYIDGTQYAEHTARVPTSDLIRFIEIVNADSTAPSGPNRIDIEADFLLPWLTA